jgi:hypothetical protein
VNSHLTKDFVKLFKNLPNRLKILARKNYLIWKDNPNHPSLNFKEIKSKSNIYSVRIGIGWRAIGVINNYNIIWFWIGTHSEYDKLINSL